MNTIETRIILDCGAQNIHNMSPDSLVRRTTLASLLVTARAAKSTEAAINAFRMWATPAAKAHEPAAILAIANERTQ